jgi:Holliday junction resolvase
MRRKARIDGNQKQVVRELRAMGYSVRHTHQIGKGFPDIVIGRNGKTLLVEIKMEGEGLTNDEVEFFEIWKGGAIIGYNAEQIDKDFNE